MKRALCILPILMACSDDGGTGTVTFSTWGEEYIEQEIPAADIEDGWTVRYTKFLVAIGEITVEGGPAQTTQKLFDMHVPGKKAVITFSNVEAKAYPKVSYAIAPATAAAELGSATEADKTLMVTNGYSVYVEGSFSKDAVTKTFTWGFKTNTHYEDCKGEVSGKETDGIVVTNGGTDTPEITIHGDHLYYDDLQSPDAKVRVDNIAAADADNDGKVTLEELALVDLADKTKIKAGPYGTGTATGVNDLRKFVEELSRTVGHFRGEGECVARTR